MSGKGENTGGLMSSAGLVTYYDSEENTINIEPLTIMMFGVLSSILLIAINYILI